LLGARMSAALCKRRCPSSGGAIAHPWQTHRGQHSNFRFGQFHLIVDVGRVAERGEVEDYFNRYTEDAVDLCDVLSSFNSQSKATLHELCRVMGLPGKPDGISGADVERYNHPGGDPG
jgi:hypothetical protein